MSFQNRPHGQPYPVPRHRAKPDAAKPRRVPSGHPEGRQHEGREALARGKLVRCLDQSCTEALPGNGGIDRNVLDVQLPSIGLTRTKPTGWPSASATITSPSVSRFAAIGGVSAANESVPAEAYRVRAAFSITCNSGMSPDPPGRITIRLAIALRLLHRECGTIICPPSRIYVAARRGGTDRGHLRHRRSARAQADMITGEKFFAPR